MADHTPPAEPAGDARSDREITIDILVQLARIEGLLDGYLLALGKRPDAETGRTE